MKYCEAQIILIGDTTANPRETLIKESKYAKSQPWSIFGLPLTHRSGAAPKEATNYRYYIELEGNLGEMVYQIVENIPC